MGEIFSKIYFQACVREEYKGKEASSTTPPGDQANIQLKDNTQPDLLHLPGLLFFFLIPERYQLGLIGVENTF